MVGSVINGDLGELSAALDGPEEFRDYLQRRISAEAAFLRKDANWSIAKWDMGTLSRMAIISYLKISHWLIFR